MVTKVCFVGDGFTRKPPKYERFIRPMVGSANVFVPHVQFYTPDMYSRQKKNLFKCPCAFKGLRFKKAHVTHPELKATFCLPILGVKKNPSSPLYTSLGVITKGTVVEVNVSELGLVTQGGKVIWGKRSAPPIYIIYIMKSGSFSWTSAVCVNIFRPVCSV